MGWFLGSGSRRTALLRAGVLLCGVLASIPLLWPPWRCIDGFSRRSEPAPWRVVDAYALTPPLKCPGAVVDWGRLILAELLILLPLGLALVVRSVGLPRLPPQAGGPLKNDPPKDG